VAGDFISFDSINPMATRVDVHLAKLFSGDVHSRCDLLVMNIRRATSARQATMDHSADGDNDDAIYQQFGIGLSVLFFVQAMPYSPSP
jgi:hypothetical protein